MKTILCCLDPVFEFLLAGSMIAFAFENFLFLCELLPDGFVIGICVRVGGCAPVRSVLVFGLSGFFFLPTLFYNDTYSTCI